MKIIAFTQKGESKIENEDRIIVGKSVIADGLFISNLDNGVLAIADGVGGNNAGAIASHFVSNKVCLLNNISLDEFKTINRELLSASQQNIEYTGMATTLSGLFINENGVTLFSIGNTRVYFIQGGKYLKQVTEDDTTINFLLKTGHINYDEAENFDRKNEITACFGGNDEGLFKIDISDIDKPNSSIMITSDGIHDYLTIDQIEDVIIENGISEETCRKLTHLARENGSCDDISVLFGGI